jgi:hypothetical protein
MAVSLWTASESFPGLHPQALSARGRRKDSIFRFIIVLSSAEPRYSGLVRPVACQ